MSTRRLVNQAFTTTGGAPARTSLAGGCPSGPSLIRELAAGFYLSGDVELQTDRWRERALPALARVCGASQSGARQRVVPVPRVGLGNSSAGRYPVRSRSPPRKPRFVPQVAFC